MNIIVYAALETILFVMFIIRWNTKTVAIPFIFQIVYLIHRRIKQEENRYKTN